MNSKRKLLLANNPLLSGPAFDERERSGSPYREIRVTLIDRDPNQPRREFDEAKLDELSHSIKTYGVLNPILVKPSKAVGRFSLIAGERRLRAAIKAGLETVPVMIDQREDESKATTLAMQLVENLQRSDLTPLERAQAIGALKESYDLSVRDIGQKLGISKSMVQRSLEILDLPADLLNALKEGTSESKILLLSKIEDPEIRASYLKDLDVLTRSKLERNLQDEKEKSVSTITPEDRRITDEIQRAIGLKVRISRSSSESESGKLTIDFYSTSDLQEVFRKLVANV